MISQQINLYQERFREKKLLLSARQFGSLLFLLLLSIGVGSPLLQMDLDHVSRQNLAIKASQEKITEELNAANAELARLLADNRADQEIAGISREISARRKVLSFVDANRFGSGQGFSAYLVALSSLHVRNVWLDEIALGENYVRLRGSALNADLIPEYFNRFSEESIFKGNRFHIFQLERNEASAWKVDFEIATDEKVDE
ncbi:MAG: hypothetical protein IIB69_02445 [Proteobacteria bacterium]|nr:hypothetical protein [Pseudomonadota bacterium]